LLSCALASKMTVNAKKMTLAVGKSVFLDIRCTFDQQI
jgi:hypothetical protein